MSTKPTNVSFFQSPFQIRRTPIADAQNLAPQHNDRVTPIPSRFDGPVPVQVPGVGTVINPARS